MENRNHLSDALPDFDNQGFLKNPREWTERLAAEIALHDGLRELTQSHWGVIHSLRRHYDKFGATPPSFRHVCHVNHLGPHGVEHLFIASAKPGALPVSLTPARKPGPTCSNTASDPAREYFMIKRRNTPGLPGDAHRPPVCAPAGQFSERSRPAG
jgi:tRNA 2-thiouridine synthesizing protein E